MTDIPPTSLLLVQPGMPFHCYERLAQTAQASRRYTRIIVLVPADQLDWNGALRTLCNTRYGWLACRTLMARTPINKWFFRPARRKGGRSYAVNLHTRVATNTYIMEYCGTNPDFDVGQYAALMSTLHCRGKGEWFMPPVETYGSRGRR